MLLFFDTETTGIKAKPYLVQLAAILTENDGTLRGSCNLIIKPEGYTIPDDAAAIHGITTEIADRSGVPLSVAIAVFNNLAVKCKHGKIIAHNKNYDLKIIQHCYDRGNWPSRLEGVETYCTMEVMRDRCKIPPTPAMVRANIRSYKSPKLSEAYKHAFNRELENAHDALYDVHACKDIYFWIHKSKIKQDQDPNPPSVAPVTDLEPDLAPLPLEEYLSNLEAQNDRNPL